MCSDLEFTIDDLRFLEGVLSAEIGKTIYKESMYCYTLRDLRDKVDKRIKTLKTQQASVAEKNTELEDIKRTVSELTEAVKKLEQRNDALDGTVKKLTQVVNGMTLYNRRYK